MENKQSRLWSLSVIALLLGMGLIGVRWLPAQAASNVKDNEEEQLVRRVTDKVIKELRESDFLQKEIEVGIERFIRKQEAQARAPHEQAKKNVRPVDPAIDHIFGNPDAEISLIEYSDFECPYCKRFHSTAKKMVKVYGGKVNWVYRHFPLDFHKPGAQKEAEASECAAELGGNSAFWAYTDRIYQQTRSNGNGFPIRRLVPLAVEIGLPEAQFGKCLDSERYAERVQADLDNGTLSGVRGTPGNILLNKNTGKVRFVGGALPLKELKLEIDRLLVR